MSPCFSVSPIKTVVFSSVRALRMKYRQLGVYLSVFRGVRRPALGPPFAQTDSIPPRHSNHNFTSKKDITKSILITEIKSFQRYQLIDKIKSGNKKKKKKLN